MLNKNKSSGFAKKIIVIVVAIIILIAISFISKQKGYFSSDPAVLSQEEILAKQIEELDRLKQEDATNQLTQEDIDKQADELNKLRSQNKADPLTQEQIQKQAEELDSMRNGQQ
ncbi:MAG: hypothetical protein AAB822_00330 [Patescibacteria group bacterium]|mgnify:CR=1